MRERYYDAVYPKEEAIKKMSTYYFHENNYLNKRLVNTYDYKTNNNNADDM